MAYLDVLALLGTHQLQNRTQTGGVVLNLGVVHLLLVAAVDLVSNHCEHDVLGAVGLQLLHPFLHDLVGALGSDVVDAEGDAGLAVVDGSDGAVFLLPGSVPDLLGGRRTWNSMDLPFERECFLVRKAAPRVGSL